MGFDLALALLSIIALLASAALFALSLCRLRSSRQEARRRENAAAEAGRQVRFFQTLIDALPVPVFFKDTEGVYLGCNAAFEQHVGLDRERIIGRRVSDIAVPEYAERSARADEALLRSAGVETYEAEDVSTAGSRRSLLFHRAAFLSPDGRLGGIIGSFTDITERKRTENELRRLKEFNERIVLNATEGIVTTDAAGTITFVNPAAAAMLGCAPGDLIGNSQMIMTPEDQQEIVRRADERRCRGLSDHYELDLLRRDGARVPVVVGGGPLLEDGRVTGTLAVFSDISEQKRLAREIRELSLRDELTGLLNRRGFSEFAQPQLRIADRIERRLLLVYIDVDDLKIINDRYGHTAGDRALIDTAEILRRTFRSSDLLARIGGDEFVALGLETAYARTEVLRRRIEERLDLYNSTRDDARPWDLSLSVGVGHYEPHSMTTLEGLLTEADQLMYREKRSRKPPAGGEATKA